MNINCIPGCGDFSRFHQSNIDRYQMPNSPTCRLLTTDRSLVATTVNAFVNTYNDLLASDQSIFLKSLGVVVLSTSTAIVGTALAVIETISRIALLFLTRVLSLTCIFDAMEGRPLCSNPIAQIPIHIGKTSLIALSTLFIGAYAGLEMLVASENIQMEEVLSSGSVGITPKAAHCLFGR